MTEPSWVPDACTLPSRERPLCVAEFAEVFASALRTPARLDSGRLRLTLDSSAERETTVRDLVARESACCSFFEFTITPGDPLVLDIGVPPGHEPVLDALAEQAALALRRPVTDGS
jgi:hypothetical protein